LTLSEAIASGFLDHIECELHDPNSGRTLSLLDAYDKGLLITVEDATVTIPPIASKKSPSSATNSPLTIKNINNISPIPFIDDVKSSTPTAVVTTSPDETKKPSEIKAVSVETTVKSEVVKPVSSKNVVESIKVKKEVDSDVQVAKPVAQVLSKSQSFQTAPRESRDKTVVGGGANTSNRPLSSGAVGGQGGLSTNDLVTAGASNGGVKTRAQSSMAIGALATSGGGTQGAGTAAGSDGKIRSTSSFDLKSLDRLSTRRKSSSSLLGNSNRSK
jgi:hypothetical protein